MAKKLPPLRDYEEFKRWVLALPKEKQVVVLEELYNLSYAKLDDKVYRTIATAIKHAKDEELEGHEGFQISNEELKKLSHIQDSYRKKDR